MPSFKHLGFGVTETCVFVGTYTFSFHGLPGDRRPVAILSRSEFLSSVSDITQVYSIQQSIYISMALQNNVTQGDERTPRSVGRSVTGTLPAHNTNTDKIATITTRYRLDGPEIESRL